MKQCKYCDVKTGETGHQLDTAYHHGMWIEKMKHRWLLSVGSAGTLLIKYCPICGRKLEC